MALRARAPPLSTKVGWAQLGKTLEVSYMVGLSTSIFGQVLNTYVVGLHIKGRYIKGHYKYAISHIVNLTGNNN